jgi:hypothetical protein
VRHSFSPIFFKKNLLSLGAWLIFYEAPGHHRSRTACYLSKQLLLQMEYPRSVVTNLRTPLLIVYVKIDHISLDESVVILVNLGYGNSTAKLTNHNNTRFVAKQLRRCCKPQSLFESDPQTSCKKKENAKKSDQYKKRKPRHTVYQQPVREDSWRQSDRR